MARRTKSPIEVTTTPVNIADGLSAGLYQFQPVAGDSAAGFLYAFGHAAPTDTDDYHIADYGELVEFRVPNDSGIWLRLLDASNNTAKVAISRL